MALLCKQEFQEGLVQMGLNNVDPGELERVFRFFDADQSGKITLNELLRGLRVRCVLEVLVLGLMN